MSVARSLVLRPSQGISLVVSLRFLVVTPVLIAAILVSAFMALNLGNMTTEPADVFQAIFLPSDRWSDGARAAALFRLPRIGVALFAGAMMAASGYLLQVVSRNGLADPGILGLSEGAAVAVLAVLFLVGPAATGLLSLAALAGAFLTACLVLAVSRGISSGGGIILVGLAVNVVLGAAVQVILVSGSPAMFSQLLLWSKGTLATVSRDDFHTLALWLAVLFPAVLLLSRMIAPLLLGDEAAMMLGVPVRLVAALFVLLATGFAAPVVASCGPVAFIGLLASHLARGLVGPNPTERLIVAMLSGGLVLLWADTLGRWLFAPMIVPAGIAVTVVGAIALVFSAWLSRRARVAA